MSLKKHRSAQLGLNCKDCRIEALEMTGLENAIVGFGKGDEVVRFGCSGGEGLFDEEVETSAEQRRRHGMVIHRGDGYRRGVKMQIGSEQFIDGSKDGNGEFRGSIVGARRIRFNRGDESNAFSSRFEFPIDTKMIATECAGANNGYA